MKLFCSHSYISMRKLVLLCSIHVILFSVSKLQRAHGCLRSERDGLLRLKSQFNPNGSYFSSWDEGANVDCCKWEMVSCDPFTNRVNSLHLHNLRVSNKGSCRPLNASFFLPFEDLRILNLGNNQLNGLEELPRLGKLEVLDLSFNCFKTMPFARALPSLKTLNLEFNQLSDWDDLAGEVTALKELEVLNLGYNEFEGTIPPFIGDLASLKSLSFKGGGSGMWSMWRYKINGSLPAEVLCKLKNLEELDLSKNLLEGSLPLCLGELTSLRVLDLHENDLKGSIPPSFFTNLNSLEYVTLSSNSFKGSFAFSSLADKPNLKIFELINNDHSLEVDTESPPGWIPQFQLKVLSLTNCTLNKPTGVVPSFLLTQHQLSLLKLDNTGIKGDFLSWLLGNNTNLEFVTISNNSLQGTLDLNPGFHNPHIRRLDVSRNHISGEIPSTIGTSMPNLSYLNMSGNALRGLIPRSICGTRPLFSLDLSNNFLSGEVPTSLAMNCFNLTYLKLSNNSLQGIFPPLNSNLKDMKTLHLDKNNFTSFTKGVLNSVGLSLLDVSQNALSGEIPNWIGSLSVSTLVLSKNSLQGSVPMSICNMSRLRYLDLSHNHLGPKFPPCSSLPSLVHFHMLNNQLMGPIPNALSQAPSLVTLELSHNKLSGEIPNWFGTSLPNLRILLLKGNILQGPIPFSLCALRNVSILDFSNNGLSGTIPFCLGDMLLGRRQLFDGRYNGRVFEWATCGSLKTYSHANQLDLNPLIESIYSMSDENDLVQFVTKKRDESYQGNILYYMSGLDLSCNQLEGPISPALGFLSSIHTLNLSHNHLSGSIPDSFSNLEQIESLDLSHNVLNGEIPTRLLGLNFLSVFSVAYNNLSGMTPKMEGQFATFDASSYEGNPRLQGPPLMTMKTHPYHYNDDDDDGANEDDFEHEFWFSFAGSFLVLFLAVCSYFYLNSFPLEAMIGFIGSQLSKVPCCARLAKLLEIKKNVSIRFVLDNVQLVKIPRL